MSRREVRTPTPAMTGREPGLLQDDDRKLSQWFASRPDARRIVRDVCDEIEAGRVSTYMQAHQERDN